MRITPNFHFAGNCLEAINLYSEIFDFEIIKLLTNEQSSEKDGLVQEKFMNQVYHAEVKLFGRRMFMTDVDDEYYKIHSNPLSLVITFNSAEEVKDAYEKIREGATIISQLQSTTYASAFASLVDRFGMRWELMTEQTKK